MKTKAKLTLAISTLSAVVLAAGVTSTFAWFTTQSTVKATTGTLTVKSPATLTIKGYDIHGNKPLTQTSSIQVTGDDAELGAVSSPEGKSFYAPTDWTAVTPTMVPVASVTKNPYVGFIQYSIAVTAAKGEDGKHLKAYPTVSGADASSDELGAWYRVAIYHVGTYIEGDTEHGWVAPTTTPASEGSYGAPHTAGNVSTGVVYSKTAIAEDTYYNGTTTAKRETKAVGNSDPLLLSTFSTKQDKDVVAHFVVSVWMEGYAGANQNTAGNQKITVTANFELY